MRITPCEFCKEYIDIVSDHQPICPNLPPGVRSNKVVDAGMWQDGEDIEPSDATRRNALWVRRFLAHREEATTTIMENGTIMLEWFDDVDGNVLLEIGDTNVAILVQPTGERSWYVNGRRRRDDE